MTTDEHGQRTALSRQQKLLAMAARFYSHLQWTPKAGDYYTSARADLELYRVVKVEAGTVYTEYCTRPGELSAWPEKEFTAAGFGVTRVWVPEWVLAQPSGEPATVPVPAVLFDGYSVLTALDAKAKRRTSAENVCDVLDAVVRLMRQPETKPEKLICVYCKAGVPRGPDGWHAKSVDYPTARERQCVDYRPSSEGKSTPAPAGGLSVIDCLRVVATWAVPDATYSVTESGARELLAMIDKQSPEPRAELLDRALPYVRDAMQETYCGFAGAALPTPKAKEAAKVMQACADAGIPWAATVMRVLWPQSSETKGGE